MLLGAQQRNFCNKVLLAFARFLAPGKCYYVRKNFLFWTIYQLVHYFDAQNHCKKYDSSVRN